jgi:LysR family transcriptional regulator, transcriptional activator of nhaA
MRHPNYNHLLYFWAVVREGGVAKAATSLNITPQTVSGQLRLLEEAAGAPLLERVGRKLVPTELGRVAFDYAEEIFARGQELQRVLKGATPRGPRTLSVGVSDAVPKLVTYRIIKPHLEAGLIARLVCEEGPIEVLLGGLAANKFDLVLSTSAVGPGASVKAYNHLLGESALTFFAAPSLAKKLTKPFPQNLSGAPWLMPTERSAARRSLDAWLGRERIEPKVIGEFDDSALIKTFAQGGAGIFVSPSAIEKEIVEEYGVVAIGRTEALSARYYAITAERRIRHPAVVAITERAREELFAGTAANLAVEVD